MPLMVATTGRGDLKTLTQAEAAGSYVLLQGDALFSGMYLNELLIRLVYPGDPQPVLFAAYQHALEQLAGESAVEPVLRQFEWQLLDGLGYGFSLTMDALGQPVVADLSYVWNAEQGLVGLDSGNNGGVPGSALLAMAANDWASSETLRAAKRLMRQALAPHLGDRPLISRSLFVRHPFIAKGDSQ